jgi:cytidylate kinase
MAIITISRGSHSRGSEVAQEVASRLGYSCISREVLLETSEQFNIPEARLVRAIHDSPSILERFTNGKQRYVAFIRTALLRHFKEDNVVYHGLAGHFFVANVRHGLKARIVADPEERIQVVMRRDQVPEEQALAVLRKDDEERRKWSRHLYGIDTFDASLYDMVLHIGKLSVDDASEIICGAALLPQFSATPASRQEVCDLALAAEVHSALLELTPDIWVTAEKGDVKLTTVQSLSRMRGSIQHIEQRARTVPGVQQVTVDFYQGPFPDVSSFMG